MQAIQIRQAVAAEVRAALGRDGRSNAQLAAAAGMSTAALSRKLRALNSFHVEELLAIADALQVDAGRFVDVRTTELDVA